MAVARSMGRSEVDMSYVTSRLAVMPYPAEGLEVTTRSNYAEDVKVYLETRHPGAHYCVYNVSGRSYPAGRLGKGRVSQVRSRSYRVYMKNNIMQLLALLYRRRFSE